MKHWSTKYKTCNSSLYCTDNNIPTKKTYTSILPIFHWAQAEPTRYREATAQQSRSGFSALASFVLHLNTLSYRIVFSDGV